MPPVPPVLPTWFEFTHTPSIFGPGKQYLYDVKHPADRHFGPQSVSLRKLFKPFPDLLAAHKVLRPLEEKLLILRWFATRKPAKYAQRLARLEEKRNYWAQKEWRLERWYFPEEYPNLPPPTDPRVLYPEDYT